MSFVRVRDHAGAGGAGENDGGADGGAEKPEGGGLMDTKFSLMNVCTYI